MMQRRERWAVQPAASSRVLVTGRTGSGKSHWLAWYVSPVRRVLVWDTECEFGWLGAGGDLPPWQRTWIYVDELELRVGEMTTGVLRQAVRPRPARSRDDGEHERFCRAARRIGNVLTVHSEISAYAGPSPSETGPEFAELISRGRHHGISIVADGQRLYQFPTLLRDNASRAIIFALPNSRAARALEELVDSRDEAELATRLEPYHFLDWTPAEGLRLREPLQQHPHHARPTAPSPLTRSFTP